MSKPEDRPAPYWTSEEDWYEFFHFACPNCKKDYVADQGSDFPPRHLPKPVSIVSRWNPTASPVKYEAIVICTCMVQFEVRG